MKALDRKGDLKIYENPVAGRKCKLKFKYLCFLDGYTQLMISPNNLASYQMVARLRKVSSTYKT